MFISESISRSKSSLIPLFLRESALMQGSLSIPDIKSCIPALENLKFLYPLKSIIVIRWWGSKSMTFSVFCFEDFFFSSLSYWNLGILKDSTASKNVNGFLRVSAAILPFIRF